jgi:hypothetical protein
LEKREEKIRLERKFNRMKRMEKDYSSLTSVETNTEEKQFRDIESNTALTTPNPFAPVSTSTLPLPSSVPLSLHVPAPVATLPPPFVEPSSLPAEVNIMIPTGITLSSDYALIGIHSFPVTTPGILPGIVDRPFFVSCTPELRYLCCPLSRTDDGSVAMLPHGMTVMSSDALSGALRALDSFPVTTSGVLPGIVDRPFFVSCTPELCYLCCPETRKK